MTAWNVWYKVFGVHLVENKIKELLVYTWYPIVWNVEGRGNLKLKSMKMTMCRNSLTKLWKPQARPGASSWTGQSLSGLCRCGVSIWKLSLLQFYELDPSFISLYSQSWIQSERSSVFDNEDKQSSVQPWYGDCSLSHSPLPFTVMVTWTLLWSSTRSCSLTDCCQ